MSIEVVRKVKADLVAKGVDINGPCGAFKITHRVAWELRGQGYGLLGGKTLSQNGCSTNNDRYSIDWILKPNGEGVDILEDAGGRNVPRWQEGQADPRLFRPAFDPGDTPPVPIPVPGPVPTPEPPPVNPPNLVELLMDVQHELKEVKDMVDFIIKNPIEYFGSVDVKYLGKSPVELFPKE